MAFNINWANIWLKLATNISVCRIVPLIYINFFCKVVHKDNLIVQQNDSLPLSSFWRGRGLNVVYTWIFLLCTFLICYLTFLCCFFVYPMSWNIVFSGRSEVGTGVVLQCAVSARKINRNVDDGCMLLILYVFSSLW